MVRILKVDCLFRTLWNFFFQFPKIIQNLAKEIYSFSNRLSSSMFYQKDFSDIYQIEKNFTPEILKRKYGAKAILSMALKIWINVPENIKMSSSWKSCKS